MNPGPYGVLFDIDDTLIDFSGAARNALLDVAAAFGSAPDVGERMLLSWAAVSDVQYERFLSGELTFDDMLVARMAAVIDEMDPAGTLELDAAPLEELRNTSIFTHYAQFDDVAAALERFRADGAAIAVLSNADGPYQRRKMAAAGLADFIDGAVFSGDLGVAKPDPGIFLAGAASLGLPPERVVYVGDRWATDAIGALRAGLAAVWLNRDGAGRPHGAQDAVASIPGASARLAEVTGLDVVDGALARELLTGQAASRML
ncbi:putative hydrolase of the HAD superfamily [Nakamurella panacisegetis]|uniref:Putative hydrolase of the HAD superfamily n=1 Tax=Nakamurella panacisegetis TaxID=1090615 RepID=A0A1H0HX26_9ACTN|nr:HAD family hydrolase [Nakamurella panacisegetis]SDO23715.1 putative hydrolase of the HAD superfamily [Nakamurella panacisegetis]